MEAVARPFRIVIRNSAAERSVMARALWKGSISFGLVNIPVGLYSAEQRDDGLSFAQLDKRSMSPIGYRRYNKNTGEEVPWEEIVRGYE